MVLKVNVSMQAGGGVTLSYETEVIIDNTEQAAEHGEEFAYFTQAFGNGFGRANLNE